MTELIQTYTYTTYVYNMYKHLILTYDDLPGALLGRLEDLGLYTYTYIHKKA